jgi:hypothetical protein
MERMQRHKRGALSGGVATCLSSSGTWGSWYSQFGGHGMGFEYEMALAQEDSANSALSWSRDPGSS